MGCSEDPKDGNYEFFDKVLDYIDKADNAKIDSISGVDYSCCNSFSSIMKSKLKTEENAKSICKQFIKLHKSLTHIEEQSNDHNYKKDSSFLNYWVNTVIRENRTYDKNCAHDFSDLMESHCEKIFSINVLSNLLYDIKDDELNKINILYSLYEKYSKLKIIIDSKSEQNKQEILALSNQCCTDYNKARYICNIDNNNSNNSIFCTKLSKFITIHDELDSKLVGPGYDFSDYFIKLSKCPNTKIITSAVTGTVVGLIPLIGVLYKFTPMGQLFKSKIGILNKDISNNDEEIIKMSLMEQENEQLKFQKGTYNIKYQSV
ncbi:unnamed protein product [Plasmodium vivax]|uniref:(malaria parasite P. vivax) hypothetical protein n=1 Tax=Plasmodium vivax TaxID=5855 RepID=A0A8S4HF14_PLAVI|nr:unnamed protein product [Plasmodium vivax]